MCLIIATPAGASPDFPRMREASLANTDGYGLAVARGGKIDISHSLTYSGIEANLETATSEGLASIVHMRIGTQGTSGLANCQPLALPAQLMAFAHNGIFGRIDDGRNGRSDTVILRDYLNAGRINPFQGDGLLILAELCGGKSKLAALDRNGEIVIVNSKAGQWSKGVWYSAKKSKGGYDPREWSSSFYSNYSGRRYGQIKN